MPKQANRKAASISQGLLTSGKRIGKKRAQIIIQKAQEVFEGDVPTFFLSKKEREYTETYWDCQHYQKLTMIKALVSMFRRDIASLKFSNVVGGLPGNHR